MFFALLTLNFQCDKEDPYRENKFEFVQKLEVYPLKKTYAVNDTIWIEFNNSDKRLFDQKSNSSVLFDTGSIFAGLYMKPLYNTPTAGADGFADFVVRDAVQVDSFNHDAFGIFVYKLCSEPDFHFKIGFVVRSRGFYALHTGRYRAVACPVNTNLSFTSEISFSFNISDTNRDVYEQIPESVRKQYAHTWLDYGHSLKNVLVIRVE